MHGYRWFCLVLALTAIAPACAASSAAKPSRAASKGCAWEKLADATVGLDAWVERCDYGSRKIDFVFSGHALAQRYDAGAPDPLVEVLDLRAGESVEAGLARLFGEHTDKVAGVWPKAQDFGFPSELAAFGLQFGHGLGLAIHERPIISRVVSLDHPMEIKTGMVFALETYCPAKDGFSAARIEEEMVVTDTGCRVISLFPAEELPIANEY